MNDYVRNPVGVLVSAMVDDDSSDEVRPDVRERDLLGRWAGGDRRAGDELVLAYFKPVREFFCCRLGGGDEQEDLVQETFLQLGRSAASFRGEGTVRAFVFSISRNLLYGHWRRVSRVPELDPYTTSMAQAVGRQPSSMLRESEEHRLLLDALRELCIDDFQLLTLYYWDEMTGPELSALYGELEPTIRGRIAAARGRLRQRFIELSELARERQPTEELVEQLLPGLRDWWRDKP